MPNENKISESGSKQDISQSSASTGYAASRSIVEEVLSALWLIAALLAWIGGIHWLAYVLFCKAMFDVICTIRFAISEALAELRSRAQRRHNDPNSPTAKS